MSQLFCVCITGAIGDKGALGPPGETGARGMPGISGDPGVEGDPGPDGARGDQGDQGEAGSDGLNGLNGVGGPEGEAGQDGVRGQTGDVGPPGTKSVVCIFYFCRNFLSRTRTFFSSMKSKKEGRHQLGGWEGLNDAIIAFRFCSQIVSWDGSTSKTSINKLGSKEIGNRYPEEASIYGTATLLQVVASTTITLDDMK